MKKDFGDRKNFPYGTSLFNRHNGKLFSRSTLTFLKVPEAFYPRSQKISIIFSCVCPAEIESDIDNIASCAIINCLR